MKNRNTMDRAAVLIATVFTGLACSTTVAQNSTGHATGSAAPPTRVIFIVGDGSGLAQWSALRLAQDALPAVAELPVIGLVDTRCDCPLTTDSGAGATAYSIGIRTGYTMIGVDADSVPHTTVLEAAEARGLSTGMVTTTHITDATPAAFGAHVPSRYDRYGIAAQYADRDIEVLLGGGRWFFEHHPSGSLLERLRTRYTFVATPAEFARVDFANTDRLLGLFADSTTYPDASVRPSLPDMARAALTILDRNPRGFFLLLENEDTDDLNHDNQPFDQVVGGMRELDDMIAVALEYQQRNPETLIVVVGDHETGGLMVTLPRGQAPKATFSTRGHSSSMVPLFAGGPGAEAFGNWLTNAQVGQLLMRAVTGGSASAQ
ncbi:MAG TPA: alkaline phosphatase [Longimicrobiales bacterium]|nr:alkaline phosphatase [Longimicrobiales bacterium]